MKPRVFPAGCLALLLVCTLSLLAGAQTKADISLEGPWIIHVDTSVQNWPVLVVISPGGVSDDSDMTYFHTISIDNGDGYPALNPGVYCLTFDTNCTPQPACYPTTTSPCPTSLSQDGYPHTVKPLPVNVSASWDWTHKWVPSKYAIAFILPMPDYYTTASGWYMRFSDHFDITGQSYNYTGRYATSVLLHYDNGATTFGLKNCSPQPGVKLDLSQCTSLANTNFDNIGTLHLTMRSPDNNDACDPHVRRAYPNMLGLLDEDNSKFKVVDLAHGVEKDGKTPIFDVSVAANEVGTKGYRCLEHDLQGGGTPQPQAHLHALVKATKQGAAALPTFPWLGGLVTLDAFIAKYNEAADNDKDPRLKDPKLLLNEIDQAYQKLDPSFPRFSQAAWIQTLLKQSMKEIDTMLRVKQLTGKQGVELSLKQLKADEKAVVAGGAAPTKTGNDCKAPVVLAQ